MIRRRGSALIYVIAITALLAMLLGFMVTRYILRSRSVIDAERTLQNLYTAEAGIKIILSRLTSEEGSAYAWWDDNNAFGEQTTEKVFNNTDDKAKLSVSYACGYIRMHSESVSRPRKIIEVTLGGTIPDKLDINLWLPSKHPLILQSGSHVIGKIKLNREPLYRGGGIQGVVETEPALKLPAMVKNPFVTSAQECRSLLATPSSFMSQLVAPQVFSPDRHLPANRVYVYDAVLIENHWFDSLWTVGSDVVIASTADIQLSGNCLVNNPTFVAIGTVRVLDNVHLNNATIYSETAIEIRENAICSGVFIAPVIIVADNSQLSQPTMLYSGPPFKQGQISLTSYKPLLCCLFNLGGSKNSHTVIADQCQVNGFVYSHVPIDLRGSIYGWVHAVSFLGEALPDDSTNTNVLNGTIWPYPGADKILLPLCFKEINDFIVLSWQELE